MERKPKPSKIVAINPGDTISYRSSKFVSCENYYLFPLLSNFPIDSREYAPCSPHKSRLLTPNKADSSPVFPSAAVSSD